MLTKRLTPGLAAYLVLVIAGLFLPIAAVSGYLAIAMYYIIPFRRATRHSTAVSASRTGDGIAAERLRPWLPR